MGTITLQTAILATILLAANQGTAADPIVLLREADRLAWLRAWTAAAPLYAQAEKLFTARGDERNALYARVSYLRSQLPRLPITEVSARLAQFLDHSIVKTDDRLRLRCLVIKGETDEDLDPSLAEHSWRAVQALAEKLGDAALANRARGELGLVAFLQGDVGGSVTALGRALKIAESNGDLSSQVRWLTLFGHGYVQLDRPQEALDFYDRALALAATVPELQFPVMTHVGRAEALLRLQRFDEADRILERALAVASRQEARGYQAELTAQIGLIAHRRGQTDRALALLTEAVALARQAGGDRIVAQIALETARIQRARNALADARRTLQSGIAIARRLQERLLLPQLLSELADLRSSQQRYAEATVHLDEASDLLEGLLTSTASPWTKSRLIAGMDTVFLARIRLEGARQSHAARMLAAIEQARARSLLELLVNKPVADQTPPAAFREGERQIADLQTRLLQTTDRRARQRLLAQIFAAEERLAPLSTELFDRARRRGPRMTVSLSELQRALTNDELLVAFAVLDPSSYAVVVTRTTSRVQLLPSRAIIRGQVETLLGRVQSGDAAAPESQQLGTMLLTELPELTERKRLIVSPDAELHQMPFEILTRSDGRRLLETHVVTYVPSASVLAVIRSGQREVRLPRVALAISASPAGSSPEAKGVTRTVYDLDASKLRPLPAADDEARSVQSLLGAPGTTVLLGASASEAVLKQQPLSDFHVLHFAAHGLLSTKFPARSALLLHAADGEDGLLQAREILMLRLNAELVTLSACDTGGGSLHGQDGVASLVRPFLAAGSRAVVANLWTADDTFSLALMREFYRRLAAGTDVADAMRGAKLHMLASFGPQAIPRLWSGVLVYGDGTGTIARSATVGSVKE